MILDNFFTIDCLSATEGVYPPNNQTKANNSACALNELSNCFTKELQKTIGQRFTVGKLQCIVLKLINGSVQMSDIICIIPDQYISQVYITMVELKDRKYFAKSELVAATYDDDSSRHRLRRPQTASIQKSSQTRGIFNNFKLNL